MDHILSLIIFFPLVAGILGFFVSKDSIRVYGIVVAALEFSLTIALWLGFDANIDGFQFVENVTLISHFGMSHHLGVDGISLFLVILSTFMTLIALIGLSIKKENLDKIYKVLKFVKVAEHKTIDMNQGNKQTRIVAWTFQDKTKQENWRK